MGRGFAALPAILALCLVCLACAYPESSTRGTVESPALVVVGAPAGAILLVDGIAAGPAAEFSGKRSLAVLPGRHLVELQLDGRSLARREVFLDSQGIKTVDFTGVGQ
jgi:hypothetical protein